MSPAPRIVIYESVDAPPSHRFCGQFFLGTKVLPVILHDPDRGALVDSMRNYWAKREKSRAKRSSALAANRKALQ